MNSSRKKIKTWGLTGIFAASAAIPVVLISRYVLFRNSSSINNQNSESDNSQFITPKLKSSISLSGTIDKIYDSQKATVTNTLVAQEIHKT